MYFSEGPVEELDKLLLGGDGGAGVEGLQQADILSQHLPDQGGSLDCLSKE